MLRPFSFVIVSADMSQVDQGRFAIQYSPNVPGILNALGAHLALSTYQAGKVVFIGSRDGHRIEQVPVSFPRPMGIAFHEKRLAVATKEDIRFFSASDKYKARFSEHPERIDRIYFPRARMYTGALDLHDVEFGEGGLWAVNTRFSCICTFGPDHSFSPRWKPQWISDITPEDRCHLNGMIMRDGKPIYATALSMTDTKAGWREDITHTGVFMEVPSGRVVADGLAMPHSPRSIDGFVYMLLSAKGELVKLDPDTGNVQVLAQLNGFCRGMAHVGNMLFIGMSKLRKTSKTFSKLPVAEMDDRAGIILFDLLQNEVIGHLWYDTTVEEIYDVRVYPSTAAPGLIDAEDPRHNHLIMTRFRDFYRTD